jgi:hypothetical protein
MGVREEEEEEEGRGYGGQRLWVGHNLLHHSSSCSKEGEGEG